MLQSERYFGKKGLEIQQKRVVELLPKETGEPGNTGLIPKAQAMSVSKGDASHVMSNRLLRNWIIWGVSLLLLMLLYPSLRSRALGVSYAII
jgi:hypothetical protein